MERGQLRELAEHHKLSVRWYCKLSPYRVTNHYQLLIRGRVSLGGAGRTGTCSAAASVQLGTGRWEKSKAMRCQTR